VGNLFRFAPLLFFFYFHCGAKNPPRGVVEICVQYGALRERRKGRNGRKRLNFRLVVLPLRYYDGYCQRASDGDRCHCGRCSARSGALIKQEENEGQRSREEVMMQSRNLSLGGVLSSPLYFSVLCEMLVCAEDEAL
jgi:hypothetical protein